MNPAYFFLIVLLATFTIIVHCAPAAFGPYKIVNKRNKTRTKPNYEEMAGMFEGDIVLMADQERAIDLIMSGRVALDGIVGDKYRWDDRTVHYEISEDYNDDEKNVIEGAMEEIQEKTCLKFVPHDDESDFVRIEDGSGCSSKVGKRGGEQVVTLSRGGCLKHGVVIHELVHAIGFWHEQSRTDRDNYVDIIWNNIQPGKYNNFKKYLRTEIYDYQVPYDYDSVMHYRADAFKREDTDEDTIVPKDTNAEIGQRIGLSELDARKINLMYCKELVVNGTLKTTPAPAKEDEDESEEDEEDTDSDEPGIATELFVREEVVEKKHKNQSKKKKANKPKPNPVMAEFMTKLNSTVATVTAV